jgi:hypothetical protein
MRHTHFHLNTNLNQKDKLLKRRNLQKSNAEICAVLGYSAAYSGNSLPTFRDNIFAHLQRPRNPKMDCPENAGYVMSQKNPDLTYSYIAPAWNHEKQCCLYVGDYWTQKYIFFSIHQRVNAVCYSIYNILLFGKNVQLFTRRYMRWRPCPCSSCEHISKWAGSRHRPGQAIPYRL